MDKNKEENTKNFTVYDLEMRRMDKEEAEKEKRLAFYRKNKAKLISSALGLIFLFCLFNFGFFRTMGIILVMFIAYTIGAYFDRDYQYINFLKSLFR